MTRQNITAPLPASDAVVRKGTGVAAESIKALMTRPAEESVQKRGKHLIMPRFNKFFSMRNVLDRGGSGIDSPSVASTEATESSSSQSSLASPSAGGRGGIMGTPRSQRRTMLSWNQSWSKVGEDCGRGNDEDDENADEELASALLQHMKGRQSRVRPAERSKFSRQLQSQGEKLTSPDRGELSSPSSSLRQPGSGTSSSSGWPVRMNSARQVSRLNKKSSFERNGNASSSPSKRKQFARHLSQPVFASSYSNNSNSMLSLSHQNSRKTPKQHRDITVVRTDDDTNKDKSIAKLSSIRDLKKSSNAGGKSSSSGPSLNDFFARAAASEKKKSSVPPSPFLVVEDEADDKLDFMSVCLKSLDEYDRIMFEFEDNSKAEKKQIKKAPRRGKRRVMVDQDIKDNEIFCGNGDVACQSSPDRQQQNPDGPRYFV